MLSSCLQDVVTLGWWIHSIHLCHGISGASVDRAAAVLGAGARETRIWHCSWTTGAMLHRKVRRTWLKICVGGMCNSVYVQLGNQNRRMDCECFMQDLSSWTPIRVAAHWVRLWMLVFLPIWITQQPQLSWAGCDLALHRGSFKHIGTVELPGDGWSRWNLATFLVRWGASQIEWGTFTKSQQEFEVSMCVARSETWWKKRQGRFRLIRFHFHCFFSIWHFQLGHLETFGASSKDFLPKRFMYRKLMPDIFCHQEPQIQIKCQKRVKVVTGANFQDLFMFLDWFVICAKQTLIHQVPN